MDKLVPPGQLINYGWVQGLIRISLLSVARTGPMWIREISLSWKSERTRTQPRAGTVLRAAQAWMQGCSPPGIPPRPDLSSLIGGKV